MTHEIAFHQQLSAAIALSPPQRHAQLLRLHHEALQNYLSALNLINTALAQMVTFPETDQRTVAQIIGHIVAWDRFALLSTGDILAGVKHPRMITDLRGYIDHDGTRLTFATIDEFNDYHARKYQNWPWQELRSFAADSAVTLFTLFSQPQLLSAHRLERTQPFSKRLQNGLVLNDITMGWHLWVTMIEHIAVEHVELLLHLGGTSPRLSEGLIV
jgi:hypothetical protein